VYKSRLTIEHQFCEDSKNTIGQRFVVWEWDSVVVIIFKAEIRQFLQKKLTKRFNIHLNIVTSAI